MFTSKVLSIIRGSLFIFMALLLVSCGTTTRAPQLPEAKVEPVVDTLHGVEIVDNYRWMENSDDPEVREWDDAQDAYCRYQLQQYPRREYLKERIEELMKIGMVSKPMVRDDKYLYARRDADQDHGIYYLKKSLTTDPDMVIDPNSFSDDGTIAVDWLSPSPDLRLIAYGKSSSGTENSTLFLLDIETGEHLADTIPYARATTIAWMEDNSGFYYCRYPEPGAVPEGDEQYYRKVFFHTLGDDYRNDELIFGEGRDKTEWNGPSLSPDNNYVLVTVWRGWSQSEVFIKRHGVSEPFQKITDGSENIFLVYPARNGFFIMTNQNASRYKIMFATYDKPEMENWETIVPESEAIIVGMGVTRDNIVVNKLEKAYSRLSIFNQQGQFIRDVSLPDIGSVYTHEEYEFGTDSKSNEIVFGFYSYFIPPRIMHYDIDRDKLSVLDEIKTDLELSQFEVKQVWYPSTDGTEISMFIVHRKDIQLNGDNPTVLYGYGGFNNNETPYFSRTRTMFLNDGGVVATANLRGGGEYGKEWHRAGMLENKQNSFDDFIAAAEWLIENKYTSSDRLLIQGGSNGGLLTGAVMVQRPDLMKAVISSRPLLDMLRYDKLLIGGLWVPEYGSAENPEQFEYIYKYSPYHNVKEGTAYPAVLFPSADHDTRVDPSHVRKMTALLQAASSSDNPVLMRVQRKTGHGQGTPIRMVIEELIDEFSFIYWQLGM